MNQIKNDSVLLDCIDYSIECVKNWSNEHYLNDGLPVRLWKEGYNDKKLKSYCTGLDHDKVSQVISCIKYDYTVINREDPMKIPALTRIDNELKEHNRASDSVSNYLRCRIAFQLPTGMIVIHISDQCRKNILNIIWQ